MQCNFPVEYYLEPFHLFRFRRSHLDIDYVRGLSNQGRLNLYQPSLQITNITSNMYSGVAIKKIIKFSDNQMFKNKYLSRSKQKIIEILICILIYSMLNYTQQVLCVCECTSVQWPLHMIHRSNVVQQ